jgi:hypothetical protein
MNEKLQSTRKKNEKNSFFPEWNCMKEARKKKKSKSFRLGTATGFSAKNLKWLWLPSAFEWIKSPIKNSVHTRK